MQRLVALLLVSAAAVACSAHQDRHTRRSLQDEDTVGAAWSWFHGSDAPRGRYPWIASLRAEDAEDPEEGEWEVCAGTLVHPRVVMTSASCIDVPQSYLQYPFMEWAPRVRIGGYSRNMYATPDDDDFEVRKVVSLVAHPRFATGFNNDVALLLLDANSSKTPIQLAPYKAKPALPLKPGSDMWALRWGCTSNQDESEFDVLQQLRTTLLPLSACQAAFGRENVTDDAGTVIPITQDFNTNAMMCDVGANDLPATPSGTCVGSKEDGGGPHFVQGATADKDVQYGINSFGGIVYDNTPNVMTDVAAVRNWIDATMADMLSNKFTGRVYGDPKVVGFNGRKFRVSFKAGTAMRILDTPSFSMSLTASLVKGPGGQGTVMGTVTFEQGAVVSIALPGGNPGPPTVKVGATPLLPGSSSTIRGGSVRFRKMKTNWSHQVVITQPGITVRVTQTYNKKAGTYNRWLDLYVFLTAPPMEGAFGGVLGNTYPKDLPAAAGSVAGGGKAVAASTAGTAAAE